MPRQTERLPLVTAAPGSHQELIVHRYGAADARPKAYLQASLHADETPGMLVQHHLMRLLEAAEAEGGIAGEILVVPYANPIGLAQQVNARLVGRYDMAGGGNFNRNWPDLFTPLVEKLEGKLGAEAESNVALIRSAMTAHVDGLQAATPLESLRLALARLAADADIVLDLHCDDDALMHLYLVPAHWPQGADLAAELRCRAVMLSADSGGASFDETFSTPWTKLAERFPDAAIPAACFSGTVELRGQADVSDDLAEQDAEALFRFLQRRGVIAGDPGPLPEPSCDATPLEGCEAIKAPATGVLSYEAHLGEDIRKGQVIAYLVDPTATDPTQARRAITSSTDGLLLSRRAHKFVYPGFSVAKVVGTEPLPHLIGEVLVND